MQRNRVAIDIGGTFTDLVCYDEISGQVHTSKVSTTPQDLSTGILAALQSVVTDLSSVAFFVHGSTAGLNAFLERKGTDVALITTRGFRDVYEIGRANRPEMYNLHYRKPTPLVPRRHVFEITERTTYDGTIEEPLDEDELQILATRLAAKGFKAIAVCFLHAYVNPEQEVRAGEILRRLLPDVHVSLSHEVASEWREYERTSTTVINAYIAPIMESYLGTLEEKLAGGLQAPVHIMQSNGGVMTSQVARGKPIQTLFSGPVGGAIGLTALGRSLGLPNLIGIDMGGTSFDVSLVIDGASEQVTQYSLEGHPILTPVVKIHTVGAGGGSIASVEGGGLRVGPASAGAEPGPACYGRGGTEPTVTDANVVLGRVDPEFFLGGQMRLDRDLARDALARVGGELSLLAEELAEGVCRVVNANMANAIRRITVEQGLDPRDFALVAFGGAGPMHAVFLADELDISRVVIPNSPGNFSASGMLQTDIQHDVVQAAYRRMTEATEQQISAELALAEERGARILSDDGVAPGEMYFARSAEMRYVGQEYALQIPFPGNQCSQEALDQLPELFHRSHQVRYGHSNSAEAVELVNLRVTALGRIDKPPLAPVADPGVPSKPATSSQRMVYFEGAQQASAIYLRSTLLPGNQIMGPAIVEEESCTTVTPPGFSVDVDEFGNLNISPRASTDTLTGTAGRT